MNNVVLRGYVTSKPTTGISKNNRNYASFVIAVNDRLYDHTDFIRCIAFGNLTSVLEKHVDKGTELLVQGKLNSSSYDKDGIMIYSTEVIVSTMEFVGTKKSGEEQTSRTSKKSA